MLTTLTLDDDLAGLLKRRARALGCPSRKPSIVHVPRHVAPRRQLAVILMGVLEVECGGGEVQRFGPRTIVLLEDTTGAGHITRVVEAPCTSGSRSALTAEEMLSERRRLRWRTNGCTSCEAVWQRPAQRGRPGMTKR